MNTKREIKMYKPTYTEFEIPTSIFVCEDDRNELWIPNVVIPSECTKYIREDVISRGKLIREYLAAVDNKVRELQANLDTFGDAAKMDMEYIRREAEARVIKEWEDRDASNNAWFKKQEQLLNEEADDKRRWRQRAADQTTSQNG